MKKYVFVLLALAVLVFCWCNRCKPTNKDVIKIGALLSLTGDNAPQGNLAKNGILLAVEKVNKEGGINGKEIQLIIEDTRKTAEGTINAMKKIAILDKVSGIVVTGDIEFPVVNELADRYKIPIVATICTGMIENNRSSWLFRYCYNEEQEDEYLMRYVKEELGLQEMALLYPNSTAGQAFYKYSKKYINSNGIKVVADVPYDTRSTNQRPDAMKIMNSNPPVICARGFGASLDALLKHLGELGYKGAVVGDLSLSASSMLEAPNSVLKGAYVVASDMSLESTSNVVKEYAKSYKQKFGIAPCFWDAVTYDSFMYLYEAMKKSITENKEIKSVLYTIQPKDLLLGENWFENGNDVVFKEMHIFQMNGSNLTKVK